MAGTQISVEDYRAKARDWLAANAPRHRDRAESGELPDLAAVKALQQKLYDAGFAGITWPVVYGGQGLTDEHQLAFNEEAAAYDMPQVYSIGHGMGGPTIMELGSEELKHRYIKEMLEGQVIWCQLFSEPGAGSDVASLRTRAERDGDEWVVNGQKVWTSGAQHSDYGLLIARTDPSVPKHNGITMFVLNMHAPGVTVRPLKQATGESPFNEVFFDNVRIPGDQVVGEVNAGWAAAVIMLRHERISIGTSARPPSRPLSYESVLAVARKMGRTADHDARAALASLYSTDTSGNMLTVRMRQEVDAGQELRARGSIAKLAAASLGSKAIETADEVLGSDLIAWEGQEWPTTTFGIVQIRALGIAGGSNEIQRGIIGERVLGLAKDPQLDREVPFNELSRIALPPTPTR
ncbi:MAG: acyl-CoA dehydrogenase family protein [Frankiaceae bacterium]|jgi:alkylation response protein AidB-like acyl-CoA dehydrogenase|nr:acyl-CoA dehydrogenase family protein [Frankiaceae bacterium]